MTKTLSSFRLIQLMPTSEKGHTGKSMPLDCPTIEENERKYIPKKFIRVTQNHPMPGQEMIQIQEFEQTPKGMNTIKTYCYIKFP